MMKTTILILFLALAGCKKPTTQGLHSNEVYPEPRVMFYPTNTAEEMSEIFSTKLRHGGTLHLAPGTYDSFYIWSKVTNEVDGHLVILGSGYSGSNATIFTGRLSHGL